MYISVLTYTALVHTYIRVVCVCAAISPLPRLTFVSRDLEGYFTRLPLYLRNLPARPNFRNLSFRRR